MHVEHDLVKLNIGQRSKCFLVATAENITITKHIMDWINLINFLS